MDIIEPYRVTFFESRLGSSIMRSCIDDRRLNSIVSITIFLVKNKFMSVSQN